MTEHDQRSETGNAMPGPRQPVPDLGFFAGAAAPGGASAFGGAPPMATPAAGPFGGPATSQFGGPAVNQFGGPAVNQFGSSGGQFGSPAPAPGIPATAGASPTGWLGQARSTAAGRWAVRLGVGLAIALVLGLLGVGRFSELSVLGGSKTEFTMPESVGGLAKSTDPEIQKLLDQSLAPYEDNDEGVAMQAEIYGDQTAFVMVISGEGDIDGAKELDEIPAIPAGLAGAEARMVGNHLCVSALVPGQVMSFCFQGQDGLIVGVMANRTPEETSALVDEAMAG